MPTPYESSAPPGLVGEAARLRRPVPGRVVGGVCAGLGEHLHLSVAAVRIGFVLSAFAGGAGVLAYLFLWALTPQDVGHGPRSAAEQRRAGGDPDGEAVRTLLVGAAMLLAGVAWFANERGLQLDLGFLVPLLAVGVGAVIAWSQLDDAERGRWLARSGADRRQGVLRVASGVALASLGLIAVAGQGRGLTGLWNVGIAAVAVLGGAGLIAAPWAVRLWNDLRREQTERIRATERADIAAHLHDSVLQTLALIQRKAAEPAEVARLARAQERELRRWLYAGPGGQASTLAFAVTRAAHEVEDLHGVPVELVVTGDRPLDEAGAALARALREALLNAVRHGDSPVAAYVEIGPGVEAFVRDHGAGFDLDDVPQDRMGVRQSIIGRMARHGGSARVRRLEDGTEISLRLPHAAEPASAGAPPEPAAAAGGPAKVPAKLPAPEGKAT